VLWASHFDMCGKQTDGRTDRQTGTRICGHDEPKRRPRYYANVYKKRIFAKSRIYLSGDIPARISPSSSSRSYYFEIQRPSLQDTSIKHQRCHLPSGTQGNAFDLPTAWVESLNTREGGQGENYRSSQNHKSLLLYDLSTCRHLTVSSFIIILNSMYEHQSYRLKTNYYYTNQYLNLYGHTEFPSGAQPVNLTLKS
jgi:hypothetical protein